MSHVLFVADIHLCQEKPINTAIFLRFLQNEAQECDALYLLGDLFDTWIGDDNHNSLYQQVSDALSILQVPKFFIHGNHDFLLGQEFARITGMTILPEEQVLNLYGQRLLIMHGDTLCTHDKIYQLFRAIVHQHCLQQLFLTLPLCFRMYIANIICSNKRNQLKYKLINTMDVNQQAVEEVMIRQQVQLLIHGHIHRPNIYNFKLNGKRVQRAVLGAWNDYYGSIMQLNANGINFIKLS